MQQRILPSKARTIPEYAERVFEGAFFDVYQWQQELFDGRSAIFEMIKRPDSVEIIAIKDDNVVIVHEEQPNAQPQYGFPGGNIEEGEGLLEGAQREMLEETGLSFKSWRLIQVKQVYNRMEWFIYTWLATECTGQQKPHPDGGERVKVIAMPFYELKRQVVADSTDALRFHHDFFRTLNSLDDLKNTPEFVGKTG